MANEDNARTTTEDGGFRIFVSYSHKDTELLGKLVGFLEDEGLVVLCDHDIAVGRPFTDAIKGLIAHAHVFMPLITANAQEGPWVHQETGFAMARNIPVLRVVTAGAVVPQDMAAQIQAVMVRDDLSDLAAKLSREAVRKLVLSQASSPVDVVRIGDWAEQRSSMLAEYANRVHELGHTGMLRQSGGLSSFCLPNKSIEHPVWSERDGDNVRGKTLHGHQRDERLALERHVRQKGCRLVIDPNIDFSGRGPKVRMTRLQTLLDFLEDMRKGDDKDRCQIVISASAQDSNVTILGDWFMAVSYLPGEKGYRQTLFNWHAPTALRSAEAFDQRFAEACEERGKNAEEATEETLAVIRKVIADDKAETGAEKERGNSI